MRKCINLMMALPDNMLLQDTHRTLMPAKQSATNGHVTLLKQKMLTAILRRVDSVLFEKLTAGMPASLLFVVNRHINRHINRHMLLNGGLSMQITPVFYKIQTSLHLLFF